MFGDDDGADDGTGLDSYDFGCLSVVYASVDDESLADA